MDNEKIETEKAEALVKKCIKGNRKGLSEPNYLHSFRVRDMVMSHHHWDWPDYNLFTAALLHDIVEDGGVSFEELKDMGFTERTIELVKLCTHDSTIKGKTERWLLMIAKLIEANDDDAWRIKLADLTDNLKQSAGLSLENRRFMVEIKAPLLISLTHTRYSAYSSLIEEMKKQQIEISKQSRYIVTKWTETYDIDGLMEDFSVLGSFEERGDAMVCAVTEIEKFTRNELDIKTDWNPVIRDDESRPSYSKPNKINKVVFSKTASRRDTTGYDSIYVFIEVIEVPYDTIVEEKLFNTKDCGWEVRRFFESPVKDKERENMLFNLKRGRPQPLKCHLWDKSILDDGDLDNVFDVVKTYSEDSHFSRRLITCKQCSQLYLKEFYEEIDWLAGEDPQYITYIPVMNEKEAEIIAGVDLWEFQTFSPRLNRDYPKGKPRKIYWIGK
jgi:hypothetical protein